MRRHYPANVGLLQNLPFRSRFENKGRFEAYLAAIPVYVVLSEFPGILKRGGGAGNHLKTSNHGSPCSRYRIIEGHIIMLSKISESLVDLSGAERKVAECALAEPKWFVHAAVAEIADRASVSQPTVIRFCRSLGYKGLPEFKLSCPPASGTKVCLMSTKNSMPTTIWRMWLKKCWATPPQPCWGEEVLKRIRTRKRHRHPDARPPRRILRRGQFRHCGTGRAAQIFRFGMSTVAYVDTHTQLMAASVLSDQDVLVAISNTGSSIELLDAVSIAKENGASVIALTRNDSPLAQLADCVLSVATQENAELYTPMVSRLLQLAVIDILAIGLALRLGDAASLQLQKSKKHTQQAHRLRQD